MTKKITYKGVDYFSGDQIICTIDGLDMGEARLYIHPNTDNKLYVCHSCDYKHGSVSPDLLGYSNSWSFGYYPNDYGEENPFSEGVKITGKFYENCKMKPNVDIQESLYMFFLNEKLGEVICSLRYDVGVFSEFDKYEISETKGFIKASSSKSTKHMDIKFGRLIRTMLSSFRALTQNTPIPVENKLIEDLHNRFVSIQTEGILRFETWSGDKLLDGYKTDNYVGRESTLGKSCMNNNLKFLEIYAKNPNSIELLTIIMFGKVAARCIVWIDSEGKRYHDRIYYCRDWLNQSMLNKLAELGYTCIYTNGEQKIITLKEWTFEKYPYMDSLYYFNVVKGEISNYLPPKYVASEMKTLRRTCGNMGNL